MRQIRILAGGAEAMAELNDSRTADDIWEALPISASADSWGDEIYFEIPVRMQEEKPQAVVSLGDLGYWPPGHAFCIFFGPTPASKGQEIRPASPVNVFGHVVGDPKAFKTARDGEAVTIERVQEKARQ